MNPDRERQLEAGGKTYTLYYGNRALRLIEREVETPLTVFLNGLQSSTESGNISIGDLTMLLWAGLQQVHPGTTIEDVDLIIDDAGIGPCFAVATQAMAAAFPGADDADADSEGTAPGNGAKAGTGRSTSARRS